MKFLGLFLGLFASAAVACEGPAADASRIAVAGGSITEILYFLEEQSRIVATDSTSNFPPEALEYPSVGYVRALSTEGLLSLNPSLIMGESDMGPPSVLEQVGAVGIDVVRIPEAHNTNGIISKIMCIATLIGTTDEASRVIEQRLDPDIQTLESIADADLVKPRVAVVLGIRDGVPLGAGYGTSGHGLIEMAGAENVFAGIEGWKPISMEAMIKADPQFIIVPNRGVDSAGGVTSLLEHPALRLTTAAREKQLIAMDGMSMLGFGPRTLATAVDLAGRLHGNKLPESATDAP